MKLWTFKMNCIYCNIILTCFYQMSPERNSGWWDLGLQMAFLSSNPTATGKWSITIPPQSVNGEFVTNISTKNNTTSAIKAGILLFYKIGYSHFGLKLKNFDILIFVGVHNFLYNIDLCLFVSFCASH